MEKITGEMKISSSSFSKIQKEIKNVSEYKNWIEGSIHKKITLFLEIIFGGAIALGVSDVHFEPEPENSKIRIRVDGMLQDVMTVDNKIYAAFLSRIKLLAGIKLNVADRPQDGRFSVLTSDNIGNKMTVEIRTSTLPAEHGETIVLRILNPKSLIEIESLNLRKDLLELFKKEIKKPGGMIIVTGPTGSGKTTTLYAFLKSVKKPEIKIITIEDPIEYHLKGVSQTQVQPGKGYDFSSGLKSIMRQDPDMILIGEIRDLETCQTALQAALTGHLVFTTLHANDATSTVARLTNLGAKPSNISPAVNLAIAQRLIRKICQYCGKFKEPNPQELQKLKNGLAGISHLLKARGVKIPEINSKIKIANAGNGCEACNFTGYKGRIGVFEAFLVDEEVENFILKNPSMIALNKMAVKKGMIPMKQDGLIRVLEGITTIKEIERVIG